MALDAEQRKVLNRIKAIAKRRGVTPMELKAAVETGLVESGLRNLSYGDADSQGWRQERASLYKNPTNLDASINRFFDETGAVRGKYGRAGDLAAAVQRPAAQFRGRYQERSDEAAELIGRRTSDGTESGSQSSGGLRTVTTTTPGVDNRVARAKLIQSFLGSKGGDIIDFAREARALRDVPETTTTTRERIPGSSSSNIGPSGGGKPEIHGSQIKELIFNDGGKGYGIKDGQEVDGASFYSGVWGGHANHVHVAAGPETVVVLGNIAKDKFGLHVGENSHFGGKPSGGHATNSYHYKDQAIDVSGDPKQMAKFARYVRTYSRGR